jgi:hypothetical protein
VFIEEPKILGNTNALAILTESSFPVRKFAKYLKRNGLTLYSDSLLALSQAPSICDWTISFLKNIFAFSRMFSLC